MTTLLYISFYASVLCFVIGCIRCVRQYASLPLHLRWELYPVPHEPPSRAEHGGSYFEVSDWWTKPRRFNFTGELRVMLTEIVLLKSVWESNRELWWRSLLFHFGLYCIVAASALEILHVAIPLVATPGWVEILALIGAGLGRIGLCLIIGGAFALLIRRLSNRELHDYTHVADFFHLAVIGVAATLLMVGSLSAASPRPVSLIRGALTFDTRLHVSGLLAVGILLALAVLGYVPFSPMAHFIGKYFAFHSVRWDDKPNRDGALEDQISRNLAYCPTWSAGHIRGDGRKNWAAIAAENPTGTEVTRR